MNLYPDEVFDKLKQTASKKEKIAILEDQKDNEVLQAVINLALNPHIQFFIRKIPEHKNKNKGIVPLKNAMRLLSKLSSRDVTGDKAKKLLVNLLEDTTRADSETLCRIISKDLRCGVAASTVNKVWPAMIPTFPVMLCESYSRKNLENIIFPAIIQEKSDGARVNFVTENNKVTAFTRSGKTMDLLGAMDDEILTIASGQDVMIDGELLVVDAKGNEMSRSKGNGILNRANKGTITQEEASRVRLIAWDIIPRSAWVLGTTYDTPYNERFDYLCACVKETNPTKIKTSLSLSVAEMRDAQAFFKERLIAGCEGAILKNLKSPWVNKRSKEQVKMKVEAVGELKIVAMEEGQGKHLGKLGSFLCSSADGRLSVSVGSGLSDAQREEFWGQNMVGEIISVKYNDVISKEGSEIKSLFLPIFVEHREDKTEADTFESLLEQIG